MSESWDKPSPALKRIAEQKINPMLERCPYCPHHSHAGEICGTQMTTSMSCGCRGGK